MSSAVIGALRVVFGADTAAFERGVTTAERKAASFEKRMSALGGKISGIGKGMSVAITAPLALLGKSGFDAAVQASDAIAQVNAALGSMGPVAGKTSEQLQANAKELEKLSSFDDKEILRKVTANMLTFGNISGEAFDRAQRAAVDLSARMGTDLQSSTIMIGKALNDPVKGLAALGRAGIQFTADQKELIKSMVAGGDAAGAQAIMLTELEAQFGGAGKAARDAAPGSDMINKWSELKETVGEFVMSAMGSIEPVINRVLDAFNNLSPGTKQFVVGFAAVAAAIGPVLVILGTLVSSVGALAPVFAPVVALFGSAGLTGVISALGAVLAPFLVPIAAIAAAGALIYANWDKIAPVLEKLREKFVEAIGPKITALVENVKTTLTDLWEGPLGDMIRTVIDVLGQFAAAYIGVLGEGLTRVVSAAVSAIQAGFNIVSDVINIVIGLLTGDFAGAWQSLKSLVGNVITGVVNIFKSLAPEAAKVISDLASAFATWFGDLATSMVVWGGNIIDGLVKGIQAAPAAVWEALKKVVGFGVDRVKDFLGINSPSLMFIGFGKNIAEGLAIGVTEKAPLVTDALEGLASQAESAGGKIEQSFADMADGVLGSLQGLANGIKGGGFLDILGGALDLFKQLGNAGVLGKTIQANLNKPAIPIAGARANGGPVTGGKTYLVGERGPELFTAPGSGRIVSNDNLRGGVNNVNVTVGIDPRSGNVLAFVDGRIAATAPAVANAGAAIAQGQMAQRAGRRIR